MHALGDPVQLPLSMHSMNMQAAADAWPASDAGHDLCINASDLVALGWVKPSHASAASAALAAPLRLKPAGLQCAVHERASHTAPGPEAAVPGVLDACAAPVAGLASQLQPLAQPLEPEQPTCSRGSPRAGSQAQEDSPACGAPADRASQGLPPTRKRAQPEPCDPAPQPGSSCSPSGVATRAPGPAHIAADVAANPIHPDTPAWLPQQVAAMGAAFTGVAAAGPSLRQVEGTAALVGRRVAFAVLDDIEAPADAHSSGCVVRAGLHSGRCGAARVPAGGIIACKACTCAHALDASCSHRTCHHTNDRLRVAYAHVSTSSPSCVHACVPDALQGCSSVSSEQNITLCTLAHRVHMQPMQPYKRAPRSSVVEVIGAGHPPDICLPGCAHAHVHAFVRCPAEPRCASTPVHVRDLQQPARSCHTACACRLCLSLFGRGVAA
jgi:hypothetical protein